MSNTEDSTLLQAYLLNVAGTLARLGAEATANAGPLRDCLNIVLRTAQALQPSAKESTAADDLVRLDAGEAAFEQMLRDAANTSSGARSFDRDRCELYLQQHDLGGPSLRITAARALAGGRSKQTVLVEQEHAQSLPQSFVIRQDWAAGAVQGTTVITEFLLLRRLAEAGLRVPRPLLIEAGAEALGAPFMIVTRMPGAALGDYLTPAPAAPATLQLAAQLAQLHSLPVTDFTDASLRVDAATPQALLAGLQAFRAAREQFGDRSPTIAAAIDWLAAHCDRVQPRQALIHNDIGCHNLLIDGDELGAVLDWELASIGHPAADLGYARGWIEKVLPWPQFVAAYRAAGGPVIDDLTLDFYTLWSGVRLHSMLLQARAGIAMRVIHDLEITGICADSTPRLLRRIAGELQRILRT